MRTTAMLAVMALVSCGKSSASSGDASSANSASTADAAIPSALQTRVNTYDAGDSLARFLPDQAGRFVGGAIEDGGYYARRIYAAAPAHMEVTIADSRSPRIHHTPHSDHFDFFKRESAAYPQITSLDIPKDTGSGFYDCVDDGKGERCSGYILLYDGFHVEVLNGDATRDDVNALLAALPMRTLATLR